MLDRVAVELTTQQDEDAGCNGKDSHYDGQARKAQAEQCNQPVQDEPDGQQEHANISCDFHGGTPFQLEKVLAVRPCALCQPLGGIKII
jgi:hypothetical protein